MSDDEPPPPRWYLPALQRSMQDARFSVTDGPLSAYYQNDTAMADLANERKRLNQRLEVSLVASLLIAVLVIGGGLPREAKVSLFGLEAPASIVSLQVLAMLSAGFFGRFVQSVFSVTILDSMIRGIVERADSVSNYRLALARFDASDLALMLYEPRIYGYKSTNWHRLVGAGVPLAGIALLLIHLSLVVFAVWLASRNAIEAFGWLSLPAVLAILAAIFTCLSAVAMIVAVVVPIPYRWEGPVQAGISE